MNLSKKTILFLIFAFYFSNTIIASDATDHIRKKVRTNNNAPAIKTSSQSLLSLLQHQDIGPEILEYVGKDIIIHQAQKEVAEAVRTADWVTLRKAANLLNVLGCKNYIKNWRSLDNDTFLYFAINKKIFTNQTYQSIYNSKQTKTMQELLNYGVDVNVQNNNRESFMYDLVRQQNLHLIKKLKKDYAVQMNNGKNLIHAAIKFNKSSELTPEFIDLIETLVFFGEDINTEEKENDAPSYTEAGTPLKLYKYYYNHKLGNLLKNLGAEE